MAMESTIAVELSFVVFKAQDAVPMVEVRDLVGRPVAQLTPVAEGPTRPLYVERSRCGRCHRASGHLSVAHRRKCRFRRCH